MNNNVNSPYLIVALDHPTPKKALEFVKKLDPQHCRLKVGSELFTRSGPVIIEKLRDSGFEIFLDLKFHDIPNQVAGSCRVAAELGVWMVNVHASGGEAMLLAAREAIDNCKHQPLLIGVTILTSINETHLKTIGFKEPTEKTVVNLASLCQQANFDGVVCSAQEAALLRKTMGKDFCLVTPGIRPKDYHADDQQRTMSVAEAIRSGSTYLVIGRPITQSENVELCIKTITVDIEQALCKNK